MYHERIENRLTSRDQYRNNFLSRSPEGQEKSVNFQMSVRPTVTYVKVDGVGGGAREG